MEIKKYFENSVTLTGIIRHTSGKGFVCSDRSYTIYTMFSIRPSIEGEDDYIKRIGPFLCSSDENMACDEYRVIIPSNEIVSENELLTVKGYLGYVKGYAGYSNLICPVCRTEQNEPVNRRSVIIAEHIIRHPEETVEYLKDKVKTGVWNNSIIFWNIKCNKNSCVQDIWSYKKKNLIIYSLNCPYPIWYSYTERDETNILGETNISEIYRIFYGEFIIKGRGHLITGRHNDGDTLFCPVCNETTTVFSLSETPEIICSEMPVITNLDKLIENDGIEVDSIVYPKGYDGGLNTICKTFTNYYEQRYYKEKHKEDETVYSLFHKW